MTGLERLLELAKAGDLAGLREAIASGGADPGGRLPSGETALMAALYRGHAQVVEALITDFRVPLDMFAAAATGRLPELRRAIADAGTVNAHSYDGWTPLHLAAFFGHPEAAAILLDAGAVANAVSGNGMRNTPLHAACAGKHGDVALLLLRRGGDPDAADAGNYTARAIAAENGLAEVVGAMPSRPSEAGSR